MANTVLTQDESNALLETLVNINSSSHNPQGLKHCAEHINTTFQSLKATLKEIKNSDNALSALLFQKHPQAPHQCLLSIHMDTVFDSDSSFQTFTKTDKNTATGPGVIDAKGGIVILYRTLQLLEASDLAGKLGWTVVISTDEETGSQASKTILQENAKNKDFALVFEPPLENGNIISNRPASANITLTATGTSTHAGRYPEKGKNAITALIQTLNALTPSLKIPHSKTHTINLGTIQGGTRENIVPDHATCTLNARFMDEKELHTFIETCKAQALNISIKSKTKITVETTSLRPAKPSTTASESLYKSLEKAATDCKQSLTTESSFGVCDGNFIAAMGTPVIDTMGAVGHGMHTVHESIHLPSLLSQSNLAFAVMRHQTLL